MHFTIPASRWNLPLIDALKATGYMWELIGIVNMVAGLALVIGRFVPLALIVLAPISLNILLIHLANPGAGGIPIGLAIGGLQIAVSWLYWSEFRGLFTMNASLERIRFKHASSQTCSIPNQHLKETAMTVTSNPAQTIATDFKLESSHGQISLSSYRGKNVALYFMRDFTCPICTSRVMNLKRLSAALRTQNTEILIVAGGNSSDAAKFAKRHSLPFPVLADTDGSVYQAYNLEKIFGLLQRHGLFLINQRGIQRFAHTAASPMSGFSLAELEREINQL